MTRDESVCQSDTVVEASETIPWLEHRIRRVRWYLANRGLMATLNKIWSSLMCHSSGASRRVATNAHGRTKTGPSLNLQPGELVEVRSEEEILPSLDGSSRSCGLLFMSAQRQYCGKQLRVYKRVSQIAIENGGGMRRLKDTVLLEGAICNGESVACDRSCFFFWREAWLKRVEANGHEPQS